jgi:RNA polymerase sigma factor (sigma-70 family)
MRTLRIEPFNYEKPDDDNIVSRILKGEKELFEILLRRHNQTLYRVLRSYLHDETEIEDAMQETYLKAYAGLDKFRGESTFSTWLIRIGINEALIRIRDIRKKKVFYLFDDRTKAAHFLQTPDNSKMNPEKRAIQIEIRLLIERSIDRLPGKYRIVYILKEVEGWEIIEIAAALDLSAGNVKVRLHRARNLLKDALYTLSCESDIFEFGKTRCDRVVERVMHYILTK